MTSCESGLMTSQRMPCVMASERSSINALYSAMLFVDRPIHTPLKLTNSPLGSKMAQAVEDKFRELRHAPSAYPTKDSNRFDICDKCKKWIYLTKTNTLAKTKYNKSIQVTT